MASFKKHESGWEFRIRYKDLLTGKFKEKSERGFTTKVEAKKHAEEMERKINLGYEVEDMNLNEWLNIWLEDFKKGTIRLNTLRLHRNNIDIHILPYFKKISIKNIQPIMYQKFIDSVHESGLSRRTVELIHATFHNAMQQAVIINKLEKNPCFGVKIKGNRSERTVKFIDSSDIPVFLQCAHKYGYIYWIFFRLIIETGMRKGEAAALKWTDIDFKERNIIIDETLDFQAGENEKLFGEPKTFRSKRVIKISKRLENDLRFHLNWQNQNKLNLGQMYKHDLNLVLSREDGDFMPKSSLFNAFERILKRANLPKLPIHSLRHTCAVLMIEAGVDMKFIQEQLGHGSIQITSDVYSHTSIKIEKRNTDKIDNYIDSVFN